MNDPLPPLPTGTPSRASIDGILDGRIGDADALQRAAAALGQSGAGPFRCDLQGGRFSLLPVDTQLPPGFDAAAQARFLDALRAVVAAAQPGSVETNLRSRMVYAEQVAETLFVVRGAAIEPLTRVRPRTADDAPSPTAPAGGLPGMRRRDVLLVAPLVLLLGALLAYHQGYLDRLLAARAETLRHELGPFVDLLALQPERQWGNYRIVVQRGARYPATPQALAAQKQQANSLEAAAACDVIGSGGELFVQLRDQDGKWLAETRCTVRALLGEPPAPVLAELAGHRSAAIVALSLSSGREPK
jgi:hypothetical protein